MASRLLLSGIAPPAELDAAVLFEMGAKGNKTVRWTTRDQDARRPM